MRMISKSAFRALVGVMLLASSVPGSGQVMLDESAKPAQSEGVALSLDDVIRRVQQENPSLLAARREVDAAQALREQAALRPNPVLSLDQQRIPSGNRAYAAGVSYPIELGGKRAARIAAAESNGRAAEADVAQRGAEVRSDAIQAFFDVLGAQDRMELARASMEVAQRATDVASRRVRAGRVSPVEEARARVAEATARIELSQASSDLETAKIRLSALWGGGGPTTFAVLVPGERLPATQPDALTQDRLHGAPVLVRARAEVERRESLVRVARSLAVPEAAVNVGTGTLIETGQRSNQVGLSVSIPIFDRNQGNIREAGVRVEQARQELRAAELAIRAGVMQAVARLTAARREAELAQREILPEANRTLDATTRGFELGRFSFLDVLDAQRTLFSTRGQLLRALAEAYQASSEVERLLGPPPTDAQKWTTD